MTTANIHYTASNYDLAVKDYNADPNSASEAEVEESITNHLHQQQADTIFELANSSDIAMLLKNWSDGDNAWISGKVGHYADMASHLDPAAIKDAYHNGILTRDQANMLILMGSMRCDDISSSNMEEIARNFLALPADEQDKIIDELSTRQVTPDFNWEIAENDDGTFEVNVTDLNYVNTPLTDDQKTIMQMLIRADEDGAAVLNDAGAFGDLDDAIELCKGNGNVIDSAAIDAAVKLADIYTPKQILAAADAGLITQEQAEAAVLIAGLKDEGVSNIDIGVALNGFYQMSDGAQDTVIQTMISNTAERADMASMMADETKMTHWVGSMNINTIAGSNINFVTQALENGSPVKSDEIGYALAEAMKFSASEIQSAVPDYFTQETANLLIVMTGLKNDGLTDEEIAAAMQKFMTMPDEDKSYVLSEMSERTTAMSADFAQGEVTHPSSPPTAEQQAIGMFLVNQAPQDLDGIQDFVETTMEKANEVPGDDTVAGDATVAGGDDTLSGADTIAGDATVAGAEDGVEDNPQLSVTREEVSNYLAQTHNWDKLPEETQETLVDQFMYYLDPNVTVDQLGNIEVPIIDDEGNLAVDEDGYIKTEPLQKPLGPDDLRDMGLSEDQTIDVGTLMFLVLMERMETQQDIIRDYEQQVEEKNADAENAAEALEQLRSVSISGDETADIGSLTFETQSGKVVDIVEYCEINDIALPTDADGNVIENVSPEELENVISNIDSFQQSATSDADNATQYLQRAMDKLTNTNSMLTNFESTWTNMIKAIIGNLRV